MAFREGRPDALERVYREHEQAVDAHLRKLAHASGRRALAQSSALADLVQEVFVRAFAPEARSSYDGIRDYLPYLLAIARNCFVDALRLAGREVPRSNEELLRLADAAAPPPDPWCEGRALQVLGAYVRDLPADLRRVYEQRFVLGRSQDQSSVVLGISRRAVRTAEARLRRGLRRALGRGRSAPTTAVSAERC